MPPKKAEELRIKIFADGAEKASIIELAKKPYIKGFTTNPTLMRKAGITDYVAFAKDILTAIKDLPISFEVFSDDFIEMERQARIINSWGDNVYVKIPITNTKRESSFDLVKKLAAEGIKMNLTAILTAKQVAHIIEALNPNVPAVISVFAGRIANTGVDPMPVMREAKALLAPTPNYELLWASTRELYNVYQAEELGVDIITVPHDILKHAETVGYDLHELSLDTVKMFYDDGQKVGYSLY
jgi:transaldolase